MRDFKFKAWLVIDGEGAWLQPQDFRLDGNGTYYERDDGQWVTMPTLNTTLMQYTGLKDKNGVEIYEGDIVNTTMSGIVRYDFKSKVVFKDGTFGVEGLEELPLVDNALGSFKSFAGCPTEDLIEVIGNIYENPELLKQGVLEKKKNDHFVKYMRKYEG